MTPELFFFCLTTSMILTGIHVATWKGHILFGARNWVAKMLYKAKLRWLEKPMYDCLPCMASFWGLIIWAIDGMDYHPLIIVLCVAGINSIIERFVFETAADETAA